MTACFQLVAVFQKWLKPGGQLLMTTYVGGVNTDHPDDFKDYLKNQRGYILVTRAKEEELWKRQANRDRIEVLHRKPLEIYY